MVGMQGAQGAQGMQPMDGLASGLDTNQFIQQMIQAKSAPIQRIEQEKADKERTDDAWSDIASKLSSLRGDADTVADPADFDEFTKADSTDEDLVTATADGPGADGELTFSVEQLASHQQSYGGAFEGRDAEVGAGELTIDYHGTLGDDDDPVDSETLEVAEGTTLEELVAQINDEEDGLEFVQASLVQHEPGVYGLMLQGTEEGEQAGFAIELDGGLDDAFSGAAFSTVREAQDAELRVGDGLTVTRPTNEIDDLLEDTTIELHQASPGDEVTVSAGRDVDAAVGAATDMISGVGDLLSTFDELTGVTQADDEDDEDVVGGVLQGEPAARQIADGLRRALTEPREIDGETVTPRDMGIEVNRFGELELDESALAEAFETDFDRAAAFFAGTGEETEDGDRVEPGLAGSLLERLDVFEGPGGTVDRARDSLEREMDADDDRIARHERRLENREQTLRRQFTAMETQLSELQGMQQRMQMSF